MGIKERVLAFINRHHLLDNDGKYIVALSGGADSVALLLILKSLGYNIEAAHCNFHLRDDESNRDERFVKDLCKNNGIELHLAHFDTIAYSQLHKVSIEMAARNLRYTYFNQLAVDISADGVCVAHHRDDSVETFFINLTRGTGIHGLTGIKPLNGNILRPFLCLSRLDIENYLHSLGQDYVTDSSNLVDDVMRNKIRLNLIPLLKDINPRIAETIFATTERLTDVANVFDKAIADSIERVIVRKDEKIEIDIAKLKLEVSSEYVLFSILKPLGFQSVVIRQIYYNLNALTGKCYYSDKYELLFNRGVILVVKRLPTFKPLKIPEYGNYDLGTLRFKVQEVLIDNDFKISRERFVATLDAHKVKFPLTIRTVIQGERFVPFGMKGAKLISDYLTDRKKNLFDKKRQLVVSDADDNVIWLVGERTDNRFRIDTQSTRALVMTFYF